MKKIILAVVIGIAGLAGCTQKPVYDATQWDSLANTMSFDAPKDAHFRAAFNMTPDQWKTIQELDGPGGAIERKGDYYVGGQCGHAHECGSTMLAYSLDRNTGKGVLMLKEVEDGNVSTDVPDTVTVTCYTWPNTQIADADPIRELMDDDKAPACGFHGPDPEDVARINAKKEQVAQAAQAAQQQKERLASAIKIDATELHAEYADNEVLADSKYKDKLLSVSGVVGRVRTDFRGTPIVELVDENNRFNSIDAIFSDSQKPLLMNLKSGDLIRITCAGAGMRVGSPKLDCTQEAQPLAAIKLSAEQQATVDVIRKAAAVGAVYNQLQQLDTGN